MTKVYKAAVLRPIIAMANSPKILVIAVVISWLVAALLFAIIEHTSIIDSLYWAMTTMSTVGYGDLSPATSLGKVVTMMFQMWSIFVLVPCTVANVVDAVRRDNNQYSHEEQEWVEGALKNICNRLNVEVSEPPKDTNYEEV